MRKSAHVLWICMLLSQIVASTPLPGRKVQDRAPAEHSKPAPRDFIMAPHDDGYDELIDNLPELAGASLIEGKGDVPHTAVFNSADQAQLEALADALLRKIDPRAHAGLRRQPERASAFQSAETPTAIVLQHHVGGVDVLGSTIVLKLAKNGAATLVNGLIPTDKHQKRRLSAADAVSVLTKRGAGNVEDEGRGVYVRGVDGPARLAYEFTTAGDTALRLLHVDAETGEVLAETSQDARIDIAVDDIFWPSPPITITGTNKVTGDPITCWEIASPFPVETSYYAGPFALNPPQFTVNSVGIAMRLRAPPLGITALQFTGTKDELDMAWGTYNWTDVANSIYRVELPCMTYDANGQPQPAVNASYPSPIAFGAGLPPSPENAFLYFQLQTAVEDLHARFGWRGLDNDFNQLLMVQGIKADPPSCLMRLPTAKTSFQLRCFRDALMADAGLPERIPPIDNIAHEFAHSIAYDKGAKDVAGAPELVGVTEAVSDIFGVYVKSRHSDPSRWWKAVDEPSFLTRRNEYLCNYVHSDYCAFHPEAVRDIRNPKTMDEVFHSPNFYFGQYFSNFLPHNASQVISFMLERMANGDVAGYRDDDPQKELFDPFDGIGFQEMLDIFFASLDGMPVVQQDKFNAYHAYSRQIVLAAQLRCGEWSYAERLARKTQWIVNLSDDNIDPGDDVDIDLIEEAGYEFPTWEDVGVLVPSLVEFKFKAMPGQAYDYQISTDQGFIDPALLTGVVTADATGIASFHFKLEPNVEYWWRVRWRDAPMNSAPFVDQANTCWRAPVPFETDEATVENVHPDSNESVEPWLGQFSWTAGKWDGYELWVDDVEPPGGRYKNVWAHRVFTTADFPEYGEAAEPEKATLKPGALPLPKDRNLCWKIVGFIRDADGKRIDGDPVEKCFHTKEPKTVITNPLPPQPNGDLSSALAQPLSIDYDPADGADHHNFSLEVISLAGADAPEPVGPWAYLDDYDHDPKNHVVEASDASDWTTRHRDRMLPAQLDVGGAMAFAPDTVRLTIASFSPVISSPASGGTYPMKYEKAEPAVVDFHPVEPANASSLHSSVTMPSASGTCSDADGPGVTDHRHRLLLGWEAGPGATPDLVSAYRIRLFPEHCGNQPSGCVPFVDPKSPEFAKSLYWTQDIPNDGPGAAEVVLPRNELFPDEDSESNGVTGFFVQISGISGDEPGPPGLTIAPTVTTEMPVPPEKMDVILTYDPSSPENPELAGFVNHLQVTKNRDNDPQQFTYDDVNFGGNNQTLRSIYNGPDCHQDQLLTNESTFEPWQSEQFNDDPHPVVSADAVLDWEGMGCPLIRTACVSKQVANPFATPAAITGLAAFEHDSQLGVNWNLPAEEFPDTVEYQLAVFAAGNAAANVLVHHPGKPGELPNPAVFPYTSAVVSGNQLSWPVLALLAPEDAGKDLFVTIRACRAGTDHCTPEATANYHISGQQDPGGPEADYNAGIVAFEPSFWGGTAISWEGSATPDLIDHYQVNLSCEPDPANGDPQFQVVDSASILQRSAQFGAPPAPHSDWNWTSIWLDYGNQPQGTSVTCTAWVYACGEDGTCGTGSNTTGFSEVGSPGCSYTGWGYNYDNSCDP